jgi:phosphoglycolate phosphatase-like HAD superfamily hydrolase
VIDVDGTIIPVLIDFEKLRSRIREIIGLDHPLKPLAESLSYLQIGEELKRKAWDLIEIEELESISKLNLGDVAENIISIKNIVQSRLEVLLVTMRSMKSTEQLLTKLGLEGFLGKIITRDKYPSRVLQLKYIREQYENAKIIFIGDTLHDEEAARELKIEFIRVDNYRNLPLALTRAKSKCDM